MPMGFFRPFERESGLFSQELSGNFGLKAGEFYVCEKSGIGIYRIENKKPLR